MTELEGDREHVSLASILQLIDAEGITGWLELEGAGRVGFVSGQIRHASCGTLTGADAVRSLFLSDGQGRFALRVGPVEQGEPCGALISLIMDGVRLADEWHRLAPMRLEANEFYTPRGTPLDALVALLDGDRTVFEAARAADLRPVHLVDELLALMEGGVVVEGAPPAPERLTALSPPPEPEPDPFAGLDAFELTDLGRRRLRERDFDGAEAAFERALALDPDNRIVFQNLRRVRQLRSAGGRPQGPRR